MKTTVNGVDVKRLKETIMAVDANPDLAQFRFRAENEWIDGGHNRSIIRYFYGAGQEDTSRKHAFELDNDEPDVLLGHDNGANPVEYILHALAGCLTTTLVYHAAARRIAVKSVRSTYEGELDLRGFLGLDDSVPTGYQNIRVKFEIDGDLTPEQRQELIALGQKHSPVFGTVTNKVPVSVTVN